MHDAGFYAEHDIELRLGTHGRPRSTRPRASVALDDGERLALRPAAAGHRRRAAPARRPRRRPRRRPLPAHARRLRRAARARSTRGGRLVVVGAGWIGAEVAASARQHGAGGDRGRAARRAARARARPRGRRGLPRPAPRPRRRAAARPGVEALRGRRRGRARPPQRRARASTATSSSSASASRRAPSSPRRPGSRSTNGVVVDARLGPATRTSSPPATSPTPATRFSASGSASSTGPTRSTRARPPRGRCSATDEPTTGCRTSSPTSTTSAWSTPATRAALGPASCSAATRASARVHRLLARRRPRLAGMNVNVWDVTDDDPGADPRRAAGRRPRASPTPTCRSSTSPPATIGARHDRLKAAADWRGPPSADADSDGIPRAARCRCAGGSRGVPADIGFGDAGPPLSAAGPRRSCSRRLRTLRRSPPPTSSASVLRASWARARSRSSSRTSAATR